MTVVEELVSKLGLQVDPEALEVLASFQHAVHHGLLALAAGGAAVVGVFTEMVVSTAEAGAQIAVAADKLGVSTDALQELKFAADQSNVSFDSLTTGLKFLSKNAVEARQGSTELQAAFAGIRTTDAQGHLLAVDDLLTNVVNRFQQIPKGAKQTEFAIKVFGRSGVDMVPMLKKGTAGLAELRAEAHTLGVVLDKEAIESSEHFEHSLKKVKSALEGLRNTFATPFIEAFAEALDYVVDLLKSGQPFIKRLSAAFKDVGERIKTILGVFMSFGQLLGKLFDATGLKGIFGAIDAMRLLEAVLIGLGVIMAVTAAGAVAEWFLAAAPFILIAGIIGLIVDDIANWMAGNESLTGHLLGNFKDIKNAITPVQEALANLFHALTSKDPWEILTLNGKRAALLLARIFDDVVPSFLGGHKLKHKDEEDALGAIDDQIAVADARTEGNRFGKKSGDAAALKVAFEKANAQLADVQQSAGGPQTAGEVLAAAQEGKGSGYTLNQNNTITINGTNLTPAETKQAIADALEIERRKAHAALAGGF